MAAQVILGTMNIQENVPLKDHTTFRLGGPAQYFIQCVDEREVEEAVKFAKEKNLPIFILGGGSNTVFTDSGFKGVVIHISIRGMQIIQGIDDEAIVLVQAGEDWDEFVQFTLKENLHGLENLSYIPGTVGGAPVQNIGAYGVEVGTYVEEVKVFDVKEGKKKILKNSDCEFAYRTSVFKKEKDRYIILSVTFRLKKIFDPMLTYKDVVKELDGKEVTPEFLRNTIIAIRQRKLPDPKVLPTAGSFFKNPEVSKEKGNELREKFPEIVLYPYGEGYKVSAGYLIDKVAGMKGKKIGGIAVYEKHALVLVNGGNGTYEELEQMVSEIQGSVKEKAGIELEPEVNIV